MSGTLHLPPAEPPADDLELLLDMLAAARRYLADAKDTAHRLGDALQHAEAGSTEELYLRVERAACEQRIVLWEAVLEALEASRSRA